MYDDMYKRQERNKAVKNSRKLKARYAKSYLLSNLHFSADPFIIAQLLCVWYRQEVPQMFDLFSNWTFSKHVLYDEVIFTILKSYRNKSFFWTFQSRFFYFFTKKIPKQFDTTFYL